MEKIIWSEKFSVGVKAIDEQHKKLVGMLNKLIENEGIEVDSEILSEVLSEMTEYVGYHFKSEEEYMLEYDYPGYQQQKDQHRGFMKKVVDFCMDTSKHKNGVPKDVLLFLKNWVENHILVADMKYKDFFNERGLK